MVGISEIAHRRQVEGLYVAHGGWLRSWLQRKLGSSADAADIAQDTFMRVLARRQLPDLDAPRSYLSTIARGLVIDHWRRRDLERAWLDALAALPEPQMPSPESRLLLLEALVEIDRLLDTLKPAVRTAFLLAQLEGLSCPQIAQRLGVSLATAERYVAKALRHINGQDAVQAGFASLPRKLAFDTLHAAQERRQGEHGWRARRDALKVLSVAGVAGATAWLVREQAPWQRLLADASTRVGQQDTLRLADGSVVMLNTDSAVGIDLSTQRRLIDLRRGEILVTTGADEAATAQAGARRPFWVHTPFGRLQALGTRFTVRLHDGHASIAVQEGVVRLFPSRGAASADVAAGESRWLAADGVQASIARGFEADDWVQGVVAGRDIRLQALLAELERYRAGCIVCAPAVADLRLSGLFHTRDTDQALQFLVQTQPLDISYRTRYWVHVGPRARV